jgi:hypothetical protein
MQELNNLYLFKSSYFFGSANILVVPTNFHPYN